LLVVRAVESVVDLPGEGQLRVGRKKTRTLTPW
jgi:hypothetical protein